MRATGWTLPRCHRRPGQTNPSPSPTVLPLAAAARALVATSGDSGGQPTGHCTVTAMQKVLLLGGAVIGSLSSVSGGFSRRRLWSPTAVCSGALGLWGRLLVKCGRLTAAVRCVSVVVFSCWQCGQHCPVRGGPGGRDEGQRAFAVWGAGGIRCGAETTPHCL